MRIRAVALASLCIASLIAGTLAPEGASAMDSSSTGSWYDATARSQSFWKDAAKRAQPVEFVVSGADSRDLRNSRHFLDDSPEPKAGPVALAGEPPSQTSYKVTGTTRRSRLGSGTKYQSHVSYQRAEITDPTVYPYVTHGRVFMEYPDGIGFCSGTIVPDQQEDLVLTAAHCLVDPETGRVPDAIAFAPGYRLGNAPYGLWNATAFGVTEQWEISVAGGYPDARYDVGAIEIASDWQGVTVGQAFGTRGIQFNQDWRQDFTSFGYPMETPFDGERLFSCRSDVGFQDTNYPSAPYTTGMGCDMTEGSSGGGWVIGDGFINSVVSHSFDSHPEVQFGPYFGSSAQAFYEAASGIDLPGADPVTHRVSVSLSLRKHLVAKGSLGAPDGYLACTRAAPVRIYKRTSTGSWRFIKGTISNDYGRYSMRIPDRRGRYRVSSPAGEVDDLNRCAATRSVVRTHSH